MLVPTPVFWPVNFKRPWVLTRENIVLTLDMCLSQNSAILIHRGDDLREVGNYDGAVRLYSDALICWYVCT